MPKKLPLEQRGPALLLETISAFQETSPDAGRNRPQFSSIIQRAFDVGVLRPATLRGPFEMTDRQIERLRHGHSGDVDTGLDKDKREQIIRHLVDQVYAIIP